MTCYAKSENGNHMYSQYRYRQHRYRLAGLGVPLTEGDRGGCKRCISVCRR